MIAVRQAIDAALAKLIATGATFDPAALWIGVGTAIVDHGIDTTMSNITAATGAMAVRQAVGSWGPIRHQNDGSAVVDAPSKVFAPASAAEAQTLQVWFLADALSGGNLLAYEQIQPPAFLTDQFDEWGIVLRLALTPTGIASASAKFDG